ncbi:hypothetical protein [Halorubrum salinum]|uniref:hypothetical protein n=1 Tax=Halorubrum salinum TaxID=767517 RepID=UPI002112C640|nr:hypothetical protein [Halorubrum salinum]
MSDLEEKAKEYEEDLRVVANADCSASWIAQTILERFDMDKGDTTNEPKESISGISEPSETKESVFAY